MSADGYKEKGNEEYKKGNYEKAIEFYTYATEMDPKNHIYMTNRSMCYAAMKKWDKSLRDAEKSVQLNPKWEKGYYRQGVAYQNMGQHKEAVRAFKEAMQLAPKNDDFVKAYEAARKKLFKGMSESEVMKMEGNDLFKAGKIDDAIKKYTTALAKLSGTDDKSLQVKADIHANRAACYVQLYEPVKVKADCEEALKIYPTRQSAPTARAGARVAGKIQTCFGRL